MGVGSHASAPDPVARALRAHKVVDALDRDRLLRVLDVVERPVALGNAETHTQVSLATSGLWLSATITRKCAVPNCSKRLPDEYKKKTTWQNRGRHVHSSPLRTAWQIGHKIPKDAYDETNNVDMHRCWHPSNLFAQDAAENASNNSAVLPTNDELLQMRSVWPCSWNDDVPTRA